MGKLKPTTLNNFNFIPQISIFLKLFYYLIFSGTSLSCNHSLTSSWHRLHEIFGHIFSYDRSSFGDAGLQPIFVRNGKFSDFSFYHIPKVFYWVQVRRLCWPFQPLNLLIFQKFSNYFCLMFGVVVILEDKLTTKSQF